jgi:hypothetical protein
MLHTLLKDFYLRQHHRPAPLQQDIKTTSG